MSSDGFLVLDKPVGLSSRQALDRVRRVYRTRKAGFSGTLDPLASGVLICALGVATRLLTYLEGDAKRYTATVELGRETDTDDAEGREVASGDWTAVTPQQVEAALVAFRGHIVQRPPAYSAISVGGQRLYALARRGEVVVPPEREVTIHSISVLAWEPPLVILDVQCSKGTYIRALARDLGRVLGCTAYLAGLRRTTSGAFDLEPAVTLEQLEGGSNEQLARHLLPPRAGVTHLPCLTLTAEQVARVRRGQGIDWPGNGGGTTALVTAEGTLVAIGEAAGSTILPEKVLAAPSGD